MLDAFSRVGVTAVLSLGLVVAATGPATGPSAYAPDVQLTATVLAMGGLGYEDVDEELVDRVLAGRFGGDENTFVGLEWPGQMTPFNGTLTLQQSVDVGTVNIMKAIEENPDDDLIVVGASGSTLAVNEVMRLLAHDPNAPGADRISFVVLGDADRGVFKQSRGMTLPLIEYRVQQLPVTQYDVLVVKGEYDGLGDWPDRSWNLLAVLNALAGSGLLQQVMPEQIVETLKLDAFGSVHYDTMFADLENVPAKNITIETNAKGGTTTTYLVPTADLPLLRPLTAMGVPDVVVDTLETVLRPVIDSAYLRSYARRPAPAGSALGAERSVQPAAKTATPAHYPTPARAAAKTGMAAERRSLTVAPRG